MDWMNQTRDMFKTWTDMQQQMLNGWMDTMRGMNPGETNTDWGKNVSSWEDSVKSILTAQAEWTRMWARSVTAMTGVTSEAAAWSRQIQSMTNFWIDMQAQLWDSWFAMLKKMPPENMTGNVVGETEKALQAWQSNFQKLLDSQMEWVKSWTPEAS